MGSAHPPPINLVILTLGSIAASFFGMASTDSTVVPDSTIPSITRTTHIIALLGPDNAAPTDHGWFAADFCLLNRLFANLGKSQRWYTSINLASAIREHGPILHGNPRRSRRVVCSDATQLHGLYQLAHDSLKHGWLSGITAVCENMDMDDHLLLILLGHGTDTTNQFQFTIGDEYVHRQEVVQVIRASRAASDRIDKAKVTFLTTSCYSGGWTMDTMCDLNPTVVAAAQHNQESDSTSRSASGRSGGSVFVEALANELARSSPSPDADRLPRSFREWTSDIDAEMDRLFAVGARPQFAAKEGSWDNSFPEVTGIPQATYRERYTSPPEVASNPESGSADERVAASHSIVRGRLITLCRQYLSIKPGRDTSGKNIKIHGLIHQFIDWKSGLSSRSLSDADTVFLSSRLRHRMILAQVAEMYVDHLGLRPFRKFNMFVVDEWKQDASSERQQAFSAAYQQIPNNWIFPRGPMRKHEGFPKPHYYLAAAFADKGLDIMEVSRRMAMLCEELDFFSESRTAESWRSYLTWRET